MPKALDMNDPAFDQKNENPRERMRVKAPIRTGDDPNATPVKVCCVTEVRPWAHVHTRDDEGNMKRTLRFLDKKEIVFIDDNEADLLVRNDHVVRV